MLRWTATQDLPVGSDDRNHGVHVVGLRWLKVVSIDATEHSQAVERAMAVIAAHGVAEAAAPADHQLTRHSRSAAHRTERRTDPGPQHHSTGRRR